jgi:cyclophilin family peptidyl-prolyl cis-trans isomerase
MAFGVLAGTGVAAPTNQEAASGADKAKEGESMAESDKTLGEIDAFIAKSAIDKTKNTWKTTLPIPPKFTFDPAKKYFVNIQTNKGPIKIQFMPAVAPMHVSSFMYLARLGFFDGIKFHRVITAFMAQGGDPLGNGTGGPGYKFGGECDPNVKHDRPFLLSMANAGPGTDGSQFFLTFKETPWLDGKHAIFGEVVEGQETVKALEKAGSSSGKTSEPLSMDKVTVEVK